MNKIAINHKTTGRALLPLFFSSSSLAFTSASLNNDFITTSKRDPDLHYGGRIWNRCPQYLNKCLLLPMIKVADNSRSCQIRIIEWKLIHQTAPWPFVPGHGLRRIFSHKSLHGESPEVKLLFNTEPNLGT